MLLALSRAEQGHLVANVKPVALSKLWQASLRPLQDRIQERTLKIATEGLERDFEFRTDPVLFQSLLDNLLSNAVHYAPSGSTIHLAVHTGENSLRMTLSNSAPELNLQDLEHIFDRFWRKDTSRSGDGHSGLGLPLARTLARVLGFDLTCRLDDSNVFSLQLKQIS